MKKRNAILSVVVIALVLILALGVMVACNPDPPAPETKTVTFKDGDAVVGSPVTVDKGTALTAEQIPTAPSKANHTFDGWYVGTTKVEAGYVVNDDVIATAKYTAVTKTVTFKDGETTVGTPVTVNQGTALTAAQIPAGPVKANKNFNGWFVGNTKVEAGYVVNDDVNAVASYTDYPVVTFTVNSSVVKTVELAPGTKFDITDIPADPDILGYTFDGWFNGNDELNPADLPTITESVNYVAKLTRSAWVVTFVEAGYDNVVKAVPYTSATIPAEFIPSAHSVQDKVFTGWYNGVDKIEVGTVITADTTFTANFVNEDSYTGAWSDDVNKIIAYFGVSTTTDKVVTIGDWNETNASAYSYNNGAISVTKGSGSSRRTWTCQIIGEKMVVAFEEYDDIEEEFVTTNYVFEKGEPVSFAGTYVKSTTNKIVISDGGVVTDYYGRNHYAKISQVEGNYQIEYVENVTSNPVVLPLTFDAKGNIVINNPNSTAYDAHKGVWVKNSTVGSNNYFHTGDSYLYKHIVDGETIWIWSDYKTNDYGYATVNGTVEENQIVTVTYDEEEYVIKITSSYTFEFAGEERGTYTGTVGTETCTIVLDGFGGAIVDDADDQTYYVNANGVVVIGESGLRLDGDTFELLTSDGKAGLYKEIDGSNKFELDGFGGVSDKSSSYSTTYATYTVNQDGTLTFSEGMSYISAGVYSVEENGNVLLHSNGEDAYLLDGETVASQKDIFVGANNGSWHNETDDEWVSIDIENMKVNIGTEVFNQSVTANWNGSKLVYTTYDSEVYEYIYHNLTIVGGKLNITVVRRNGDQISNKEYVSAPAPVVEEDIFKGKWAGTFLSSSWELTFDGFGNVKIYDGINTHNIVYKYNSDRSEISFEHGDYKHVISKSGDSLSDSYEEIYEGYTGTATYTAVGPDAFAGVWVYGSWAFTFDGYGSVTVENSSYTAYGGTFDYTLNADKTVATFRHSGLYENVTCTILNATQMKIVCDDKEDINNTFDKQSDAEIDEFAGTWNKTGGSGGAASTVVFDGQGTVTYAGNDYSYTIQSGKAVFSIAGETYSASITGSTMRIDYTYDYEDYYGTYSKA